MGKINKEKLLLKIKKSDSPGKPEAVHSLLRGVAPAAMVAGVPPEQSHCCWDKRVVYCAGYASGWVL